MSAVRLTAWVGATALLLLPVLGGSRVSAGPIGLVDDFSGNLAAYTNTRILDANAGGSNAYAWQITGGALEINTTTFDGIEQAALTRTDYTLGIGEELRADFKAGYTGTQDIGLYVGAGHPTMDTRQDYVNIYMRNNGQVFSRGFNGTSELTLAGGGTFAVDTLFINHTGAGSYDLGYYVGGVRTVLASRTGLTGITGGAIGIYADVRGTGVVGNLDNLRILSIPEPAAALLAMMGLVGVGLLRKRAC